MKTEKTAVLAVTSQQKQQQRLPTKKSITSINLFTLSTLIERISQLVACLFYVCAGNFKKILSQRKYSIDFNTWWGHHNNSNPLICKSKIIVRVLKGQKLTKIVLFRIARAPFSWVRYTAFFRAATIRKKIKIWPRPFGSHEWHINLKIETNPCFSCSFVCRPFWIFYNLLDPVSCKGKTDGHNQCGL